VAESAAPCSILFDVEPPATCIKVTTFCECSLLGFLIGHYDGWPSRAPKGGSKWAHFHVS